MNNDLFDFVARERAVTNFWKQDQSFYKLQNKNTNGPKFLLLDGPMTANNPMGVHHAWGRTMKDAVQRYKAMRGYQQRYQNGFDCQGLWVEVEVEKELHLGNKQELENHGLDLFVKACEERVAKFARLQTQQSKQLGQWMDWDKSYYTMSDTNVEYNWSFLAHCHKKGLLVQKNVPTSWCTRCGTSLSQHEQVGSYQDLTHTTASVYLPLASGDYLLVWTTQPWTLPAQSGVAMHPDMEYSLVQKGDKNVWVGTFLVQNKDKVLETKKGQEFEHMNYDLLYNQGQGRVVMWNQVTSDGTGLVSLSPACGVDDFVLSQTNKLTVYEVLDEMGNFSPQYFGGPLSYTEVTKLVLEDLTKRGLLETSKKHTHSFPTCWRCGNEVVVRMSEEWYLQTNPVRSKMLQAAKTVQWEPAASGKRMANWLENMDDWCISRHRYWGLPLPFYPCKDCETVQVVSSRSELRKMACDPTEVDNLPHLHRPYLDRVKLQCPTCSNKLERVDMVGDCWLDAAVVPFATLGFGQEHFVSAGHSTGAAKGLSFADLPSHEDWLEWFPAHLVVEMQEQVRLWYYAMLYVSVVLTGEAPYKKALVYDKVADAKGKPMHKSLGNAVPLEKALTEVGADALRWYYMSQPLDKLLSFDLDRVKKETNFLRTFSHAVSLVNETEALQDNGKEVLVDWLYASTDYLVDKVTASYEESNFKHVTQLLKTWMLDFSQVYVRAYRAQLQNGDKQVCVAAKVCLEKVTFLLAPVCPYYAESLWQHLGYVDSVHLQDWPKSNGKNVNLVTDFQQVRSLVSEVLHLRSVAHLPTRQPLSRLTLPATQKHLDLFTSYMQQEVNVQKVVWGEKLFLDTNLTQELREQGLQRAVRRTYNGQRKKLGLAMHDSCEVQYEVSSENAHFTLLWPENARVKQVSNTNLDRVKLPGGGWFSLTVIKNSS